jgi:hypothetical protein
MSILNRIYRKKPKTVAPIVQVKTLKAKTNSGAIRLALNIVKSTDTLSSEMDVNRFYSLMVQGQFNKDIAKATLDYLGVLGIIWLANERQRVRVNSVIWNCSQCSNYVAGDNWHIKTRCKASGRSMQILRSNEGKFCQNWRLQKLDKELSSDWEES